jgi:hypothetical protein
MLVKAENTGIFKPLNKMLIFGGLARAFLGLHSQERLLSGTRDFQELAFR